MFKKKIIASILKFAKQFVNYKNVYIRKILGPEGQTPAACEDRSRVSKSSSSDLDQLRLQFQRQRDDADDFKTELEDLRKMLLDAQKRFSAEREGRRKLEEWTEYLEHELQVYLKSHKNDEQRYIKPTQTLTLTSILVDCSTNCLFSTYYY